VLRYASFKVRDQVESLFKIILFYFLWTCSLQGRRFGNFSGIINFNSFLKVKITLIWFFIDPLLQIFCVVRSQVSYLDNFGNNIFCLLYLYYHIIKKKIILHQYSNTFYYNSIIIRVLFNHNVFEFDIGRKVIFLSRYNYFFVFIFIRLSWLWSYGCGYRWLFLVWFSFYKKI